MIEVRIFTSYIGLEPYFQEYSVLLADYFLWNIQSRYNYKPQLFEKNAKRRNTSLDEILEEYKVMKGTKILSERQQQRLKQQFNAGQWMVLICTTSKIIGMARLYKRSETEAELHSVYVDPEFRGKKYGGVLLDRLISIAKQEGFEVIYLDTMTFMENAIKLYESRDFQQVEFLDFKEYTPERAQEIGVIFMKLDL